MVGCHGRIPLRFDAMLSQETDSRALSHPQFGSLFRPGFPAFFPCDPLRWMPWCRCTHQACSARIFYFNGFRPPGAIGSLSFSDCRSTFFRLYHMLCLVCGPYVPSLMACQLKVFAHNWHARQQLFSSVLFEIQSSSSQLYVSASCQQFWYSCISAGSLWASKCIIFFAVLLTGMQKRRDLIWNLLNLGHLRTPVTGYRCCPPNFAWCVINLMYCGGLCTSQSLTL